VPAEIDGWMIAARPGAGDWPSARRMRVMAGRRVAK
jgi:hypothetical protein